MAKPAHKKRAGKNKGKKWPMHTKECSITEILPLVKTQVNPDDKS
jgi:hypothetical protein